MTNMAVMAAEATETTETVTLNGNLAKIIESLQGLMDSFWVYIVMALAAVVVVWGAYIGIRIAIAHKNEEKINARDMVKNLIIGIVIIFVVAMGAPLLISGLSAWVGISA
jgi:succinate dehydrogenase/fumarate reductase cytochrome b subunit